MDGTHTFDSDDEDTLDAPLVKMIDETDPYNDKFLLPARGLVGIRYPDGTVFPMPFQTHTELTCPNCISGIMFHVQLVNQDDLPQQAKPDSKREPLFVPDSFCKDGNGMNCDIGCPRCKKHCQFAYRLSAGYKFPTIRHLKSGTIDYSTDTEVDNWIDRIDRHTTPSQSSDDSELPDAPHSTKKTTSIRLPTKPQRHRITVMARVQLHSNSNRLNIHRPHHQTVLVSSNTISSYKQTHQPHFPSYTSPRHY
jgi:hypothetical protein